MEHSAPRILLVDDDVALASMLREFLELQGFSVAMAHDAESGLARLDDDPPDLLVLDVMLPGISGFEALKRLRLRHDLPVVMLTARGEESERILGLMDGADDYLSKPCSPLELAARIRAILKRSRPAPVPPAAEAAELVAGPLRLDLRRREAFALRQPLALTAAEMRVLEQLMRHVGEVLSRARLTELALDRPIEAYDRSIDTLVSKLRRKLEAAGVPAGCIGGVRGQGYVLDALRGDSKGDATLFAVRPGGTPDASGEKVSVTSGGDKGSVPSEGASIPSGKGSVPFGGGG